MAPNSSMPHVPMSRPLATFWIVAHVFLVAAIFWAGVLAFPIATTIHMLHSADGYRRAVFTVESLHYDSGANDESGGPSYWATGSVVPGNRLERLSLHEFFEKPPKSRADMAKALRKGDALPVLFNPDMTDMMVQNATPRLLLDRGGVWLEKQSSVRRRLLWALAPLFVTSVMVWLARRWGKSGPLITLTTRPRCPPATPDAPPDPLIDKL